jgi:hypothetical protein
MNMRFASRTCFAAALCAALAPVTLSAAGGIVDPPKMLFQGCGELAIGPQGCSLFAAESGQTFAISLPRGFDPQGTFFVTGIVDLTSFACFPAQIAELVDVSAGDCYDACGTLEIGPSGCAVFHTESGESIAIGGDVGGFGSGDHVHVTGGLVFGQGGCFPLQWTATLLLSVIEPCTVPADLNGDGDVDGLDLAALLSAWGLCVECIEMDIVQKPCREDLNADCFINGLDLAMLLAAWS